MSRVEVVNMGGRFGDAFPLAGFGGFPQPHLSHLIKGVGWVEHPVYHFIQTYTSIWRWSFIHVG